MFVLYKKRGTGKVHPRQRLEFSKKETSRTKKKKNIFLSCLFLFLFVCLLLIYDVKRIQREKNEDIVVRKKFISLFLTYTKAFLFSYFCLPFGYKNEKKKYLYLNDISVKRIHKKSIQKRIFAAGLLARVIKLILKQVFFNFLTNNNFNLTLALNQLANL